MSQWGTSRTFKSGFSEIEVFPLVGENLRPFTAIQPHQTVDRLLLCNSVGPEDNALMEEAKTYIGKTYKEWLDVV